jgi:hypothetical protein
MGRIGTAEERQERLYRRQVEGSVAMAEYRSDEQSFRELTARLRAERLAREAAIPAQSAGANPSGQSRPDRT